MWWVSKYARVALILAATTAALVAPGGGQAQQEADARALGPGAQLAYHRETGEARFLTTVRGHPVPRPARIAADATPAVAARAFLADHGSLFGIDSQARELRAERTKRETHGRAFVRFQQVHEGVPVMGAELVVQIDGGGNTVATTGEILPDVTLDVEPAFAASDAQEEAVEVVRKGYGVPAVALSASTPTLEIYDPRILGTPGLGTSTLVWRTEVSSLRGAPIGETVLVDANLGAVLLHYSEIDTAKNRRTYTANNGITLPGTLKCSEASSFPSCAGGDAAVEGAHRIIGDVYDFYFSRHGRDSFDAHGAALVSSVHYGTGFDNAAFDPSTNQMIFGDVRTYAQADDVIGHEMTHAVTTYESNLFSLYQSGAINESLSDIFGEFIDQTNGTGNDTPGVKWLIGEDVSPGGAARSLKDPGMFGQPARMTDPAYWTSSSDGGGVHMNDGIGNKAAYLMTDGDTFNGRTVTGIGLDKVEQIYYEAATNLLTSASDYADLYNALQQACSNLIGTHGITTADCQQVKNAIDAVEMNLPAPNGAPTAPVCTSGGVPTNLFFDNLENPSSGNWATSTTIGSNRWYYPQNPNPYAGFDATWATSGTTNFWGDDFEARTDTSIAQTSSVTLPAGTSYMRFDHAYGFEADSARNYDGGVVEYSTNGGASWSDAGPLFSEGGYDGTLFSGTQNPLGGRQAFTGDSAGYGSSRLNLSPLAGQNVRFRFRMGFDSTVADLGWFIDDIRIYTCAFPPGAPTNVTATPGDGQVTVTWGAPVDGGGAISGYTVRVSPGGLTLPTPAQTRVVTGLTNGTAYTFTVSATNAVGEGPQSAPTAPVTPVLSPPRPGTSPPAEMPRASVPDPPSGTTRPPRRGSTPEF